MYAMRSTKRRTLGDVKAWPYKQGVRRRISGLGCAGCGGRCKGKGLGDWGDFFNNLPDLVTAGANAATGLIRVTQGSGVPSSILLPNGQSVNTQGLSPAQFATLQAQLTQQQSTGTFSSLTPTTVAMGVGGLGLLAVVLVSR